MAAERTSGLLREPAPFVLQLSHNDFAVTYELNVYCDQPTEVYRLYAELHRSVLDLLNERQLRGSDEYCSDLRAGDARSDDG